MNTPQLTSEAQNGVQCEHSWFTGLTFLGEYNNFYLWTVPEPWLLRQPLADKCHKFTVIESGKEKGAIPIVKTGVSSLKQGRYPHLCEQRGRASGLLLLVTILMWSNTFLYLLQQQRAACFISHSPGSFKQKSNLLCCSALTPNLFLFPTE